MSFRAKRSGVEKSHGEQKPLVSATTISLRYGRDDILLFIELR